MPRTFDVAAARRAGYSDAQIAYFLAGEYGFDVQGAQAAGYSFEQITDRLALGPPKKKVATKAAQTTPIKETPLEKIPFVGKPLAFLADLPMGIMKGTGAGVEAIAGAMGAGTTVRKAIKDVQGMVDEYMSASSKEDAQKQSKILKEAENKGVLSQVAAGINAFAVAPIDTLTQAFGTAAAPIGATAAATYAGAPAAVVTGAGVVTGGLMGLGGTKNAIYDAVREEYIKAGVPEAKADALADAAQAYSGENLGQILLGGTLGAVSGVSGIEGALSKVVGQRVFGRLAAEKAGKEAAKGVGRRALGVAAKEGIPEFGQGAQEKLATNLALQREGFDVDTMRGVVSAGTLEGIAGAGLGAVAGATEGFGDRRLTRQEENVAKRVETAALRAGMPAEEAAFEAEVARLRTAYNMKQEVAEAVARRNLEAAEGAIDVADADTGVDDLGGIGAGAAADIGTASPAPGAADVGETVGGGLEQSVSGVSVPTTGTDAGVGALDEAKGILADKKVKLATRVDTARQLLNDTILNNPLVNVNDVDQKQFDMAKNQLANGKHGGDPVAALEAVTGKKFSAPPPPASTDTSGLANIGGLGGGIGETLRASILAKVEAGETMEAGQPSVILQAAKIIKDAGVPVDVDMLNRIDAGVDAARQSGDFQGSMQKFVADTIAQQPTAPEVTAPPLDVQAAAPVADAIKAVAAPAPDSIPTIAQVSARAVGIAPAPTPEMPAAPEITAAPEIAAAPDVAVQEDVQGYVDTRKQELAAQEAADAEAEATLRQEIAARELATEEAAPEAAVQEEVAPTLVAEEVAPEVAAAPIEEAAPEIDPYTDVLADIDAALADEAIDERTHKLLTSAVERRLPLEKIEAQLDTARTRSAERAMGGGRFRPGEPGNVTLDQVTPVLKDAVLRTGLQNGVYAVQSVADLPPELQEAAISGGTLTPSGATDADGNVYIIADNLTSAEEAVATLFHEALGHVGLARQFRQRLDKVLRGMYDTNRNLRAETDAWRAQNPEAYSQDTDPLARAVEEILAQRSEAGRIEASLFAKLAAIVKDFARRMRIKAAFSDAEITAILAMAHDQSIMSRPDITEPVSAQPQEPETAEAEKIAKKAEKSDKKISRGLRKVQLSNAAQDFPDGDVRAETKSILDEGIGTTIEGHTADDFLGGLKDRYNAIGDTMLKRILYALPSDGIIAWKEGEVPALRRIATLEDEARAERNAYLSGFSKMSQRFAKFVGKNGQKVLGSTMHLARLNRVDPTAHTTVEKALTNDPVVQRYEALIADKATTPKQKSAFKGKLTQRRTQIEDVYSLWEELGKQENGHKQYVEIRDYYKDMLSTTRTLLDDQIKKLDIDPASKQALLKAVRLEREKERVSKLESSDDEFPDVDPAIFPEQYFPFKRYGDYWLRVGKGDAGREFYAFESARERNKFLRKRARELKVPRTDGIFRVGNDITSLRENFQEESAMLQEIFSVINKASTQGKVDASAIKDQIYQVYLMTLPERSIRKQFLHADNVTGFSADVFRNFKTTAFQYANQLTSLRYTQRIKNTIEEAKASLEGFPLDEAARLESFVVEIGERALEQINPEEPGRLVTRLNRAAFVWFLTSAATAVAQTTGIPVRVMPRLWTDYGYAKSSIMLAKYSKIWDSLGIVEEDDGELSYTGPTVGESQFVRFNPVLKRAFAVARDERSVFETQVAGILDSRATPDRASKYTPGQLAESTINGMSVLFNTSERVTREIAFMMAFELEYNKSKDFDAAVDKAVGVVNDTLGNYSDFNRPRLMGSDLGRALFLFKQYAVNTTTFFYNNFRRILTGGETGFLSVEDRLKAMNELTGVLLMGGLFHGITGLPLYSTIATIIDMLEADDDDEEAKLRRLRNPYTANDSDYRFRYEFMPKTFGEITIPGIDGSQHRLSDILVNGPISELSDINIASRTTFDGLWFREGKAADTPTAFLANTLIANVPGLSLVAGVGEGLADMYKGDVVRGLEKVLPAAFKGVATTYRLSEEGAETRGELPMLAKSEITPSQLGAQLSGFGSTKLAQIQKERAARNKLFTTAEKQRTALLRDLNEAMYNFETSGSRDRTDMNAAARKLVEYNKKHPVEPLVVTEETVQDSYDGFKRERDLQMRGSTFTKKEAPFALPGIQAAAPEK